MVGIFGLVRLIIISYHTSVYVMDIPVRHARDFQVLRCGHCVQTSNLCFIIIAGCSVHNAILDNPDIRPLGYVTDPQFPQEVTKKYGTMLTN